MQSLKEKSPGKLQTWVGLGWAARQGAMRTRREERVWPTATAAHSCPLPEAEAMPATLTYEELVRKNVVGLGQSGRGAGVGVGGWHRKR